MHGEFHRRGYADWTGTASITSVTRELVTLAHKGAVDSFLEDMHIEYIPRSGSGWHKDFCFLPRKNWSLSTNVCTIGCTVDVYHIEINELTHKYMSFPLSSRLPRRTYVEKRLPIIWEVS